MSNHFLTLKIYEKKKIILQSVNAPKTLKERVTWQQKQLRTQTNQSSTYVAVNARRKHKRSNTKSW